jgi:2-alkyl-3-oxoalkanoate reductase
MKVFVAGATGALGRALVPQLVAGGHEVVGMTRSVSKQDLVRGLGAHPVVADALDPDAVAQVGQVVSGRLAVPWVWPLSSRSSVS